MAFPIKVVLYKNGQMFREFIAENEDGLYFPIEMDSGTGWLDAVSLYQTLLDKGCSQATDTFRVCHSYEKWGGMQQEVVEITVQMQCIKGI